MDARISVIIPTLNEADCLQDTLIALGLAENIETIVVDGGSRDGTDGMAAAAATRLLRSPSGRARQMNLGAAAATGDILLFLHADTRVPHLFDTHIRAALDEPNVVAGAFQLHIDGPERTLRLIEWGTNVRSRYLQMPYGDQAMFLRAETFRRMGGFRDLPIMEDFEFARRLRRCGRLVILPQMVATSARRWHTLGPWRTTWTNQLIIVSYLLGMSVDRLARWYSQPQPVTERRTAVAPSEPVQVADHYADRQSIR